MASNEEFQGNQELELIWLDFSSLVERLTEPDNSIGGLVKKGRYKLKTSGQLVPVDGVEFTIFQSDERDSEEFDGDDYLGYSISLEYKDDKVFDVDFCDGIFKMHAGDTNLGELEVRAVRELLDALHRIENEGGLTTVTEP